MPYKVIQTILPEVLILEPSIYGDERGFFYESFNQRNFQLATGLNTTFVQDNHSKSRKGVLRGLHYQIKHPQGKLVRVTQGAVFDVAVDVRRTSQNFGKWVGVELSGENRRQLWIPPGFAHGYYVTSETADFLYKTSEYWYQDWERTIYWDDPSIKIQWPISTKPLLSIKDSDGKILEKADLYN